MHEERLRELNRMPILVVDDRRDIRTMIATLLECEGYEKVLQAGDGRSALALLEEGTPVDLILTGASPPALPFLNGRIDQLIKQYRGLTDQMQMVLQIIEEDVQSRTMASNSWLKRFEEIANGRP